MAARPSTVDREAFQMEVDQLRLREKADTRCWLPMVEVGPHHPARAMPWFSVPGEPYSGLAIQKSHNFGMKACYLHDGDRVFETYWTTGLGCGPRSGSYGMLDVTVYGRRATGKITITSGPKRGELRRAGRGSAGSRPPSGRGLPLDTTTTSAPPPAPRLRTTVTEESRSILFWGVVIENTRL
ncbi:hypothetical protein BJ170DRAFT_106148 [Xylariales sp. AK1849]|nr:hypothetical protein BJ170DRAFT_106148 [Xylariales sp. AK1849]